VEKAGREEEEEDEKGENGRWLAAKVNDIIGT